ncbi:MAG: PEP-CTERM sorting domain-containing protein [Acidobacteriota bacterium]|nr:PEP-CTERM sorting domain-containing protein [Acidobacteriota bacterium]
MKLRALSLVSCMAAVLAVAPLAQAQITGTEWNGWMSPVPTSPSGLPLASAANLTFNTASIDFCVQDANCSPAYSGTYSLDGFLNSNGGASGVTGATYFGGATGSSTLNNTLWDFTGTAYFVNGETFSVGHDDGTVMYVNGVSVLSQPGPTSFTPSTYTYTGATGMESFNFAYGETNGRPAVYETNLQTAATPEPSSFILLGSGLLAAAGVVRRRIAA